MSIINGTDASETLNGSINADSIYGGMGADTVLAGGGNDYIEADGLMTVIEGSGGLSSGSIVVPGAPTTTVRMALFDTAVTISVMNDVVKGGTGDDVYIANHGDVIDTIVESAGEGVDTVKSLASYTLADNVENLELLQSYTQAAYVNVMFVMNTTITYTGTAYNGTGNSLDNRMTGNSWANNLNGMGGNDTLFGLAGDDTLKGGGGLDTLIGGTGNDRYVVDDAGVVMTELTGEGTDSVLSSVSLTLAENLENMELAGTGAINASGNGLANILTGNSAANNLDGKAGADSMAGGLGNDRYFVDSTGDVITELASAGWDTVVSSINYTLGQELEVLILTGTAATATGNGKANLLTGNEGANTLDGGAGADTMQGGLGNDRYLVDNAGDRIVESVGGGTDTVITSRSWALAAEVENLELGGSANISGTGNGLGNLLSGNSGANTLDGGAGADTLSGGLGNDTYIVDSLLDVVSELASEGTDTVISDVSLTLAANLENLTLGGTSALNATGNSVSNTLTGNSGENVLEGMGGADILIGGLGNDTYIMKRGTYADTITDTDATAGNQDMLWVNDASVSSSQLWFMQKGNDLEVAVLGTGTKSTIKNWYLGEENRLEEIKAGDGKVLLASEVDALVSAMAVFGDRTSGSQTLTAAEHSALDSLIAASWS